MTVAIPKVSFGPPIFRIKQDDTAPVYDYTTVDDNQQLVPITGASLVEFVYRLRIAATSTAIVRVATIVDAANGQVRYTWVAPDTTVPGDYFAEWRVTFSTGVIRTFPLRGYLPFVIEAKLD